MADHSPHEFPRNVQAREVTKELWSKLRRLPGWGLEDRLLFVSEVEENEVQFYLVRAQLDGTWTGTLRHGDRGESRWVTVDGLEREVDTRVHNATGRVRRRIRQGIQVVVHSPRRHQSRRYRSAERFIKHKYQPDKSAIIKNKADLQRVEKAWRSREAEIVKAYVRKSPGFQKHHTELTVPDGIDVDSTITKAYDIRLPVCKIRYIVRGELYTYCVDAHSGDILFESVPEDDMEVRTGRKDWAASALMLAFLSVVVIIAAVFMDPGNNHTAAGVLTGGVVVLSLLFLVLRWRRSQAKHQLRPLDI